MKKNTTMKILTEKQLRQILGGPDPIPPDPPPPPPPDDQPSLY